MNLKKHFFITAMVIAPLVNAQGIPKKQWSDLMARTLPPAFCEDSSYFRQCFSVSAEQCEKAALSAARTCLADLDTKIPSAITTKEQSKEMGQLVGQCAGTSFELRYLKQKSKDIKCTDPSKWN